MTAVSLKPDTEGYLNLPSQAVHYRLYRCSALNDRRLLLLHGGGVDGQVTWEPIINHLLHWSEILVPDLRGTGKTHFPDHQEHPFETSEVVADMGALLDSLNWESFDLGGYSYGGLVAMQLKADRPAAVGKTYLFEPGLLSGADEQELLTRRERLLQAAQKAAHRRGTGIRPANLPRCRFSQTQPQHAQRGNRAHPVGAPPQRPGRHSRSGNPCGEKS